MESNIQVASSRIYSCLCNIKICFDIASFSLQVYAWTSIKKGDELVWSYIERAATVAQRQKALSPYGFRCTCRLCVDSTTEMLWNSFGTRSYLLAFSVMADLLKEDLNNPFFKKSPAGKEATLKDYHKMIAQLEYLQRESDTYGRLGELRLLCLLHELYKRVGNEKKRRRYVNLVVRWTKCLDIDFRPYI